MPQKYTKLFYCQSFIRCYSSQVFRKFLSQYWLFCSRFFLIIFATNLEKSKPITKKANPIIGLATIIIK